MNHINLIHSHTIPYSKRESSYVMLSYDFGYDPNGNYHNSAIASVYVMQDGTQLEEYSYSNFSDLAKQHAINAANELNLDFIYVSHN